jgi:hypothetical protein
MVRCVRNNLFHGGKFNIEVLEDTARTEKLLSSSLTVLAACLDIAPQQQAAYRDARLWADQARRAEETHNKPIDDDRSTCCAVCPARIGSVRSVSMSWAQMILVTHQ